MSLEQFLEQVKNEPKTIRFEDSMAVIDANYNFTPTGFKNGTLINAANQNNGSCKIFAFAQLQNLSKEETLACFGKFYFEEVLENPQAEGHQNIRNFMQYSWSGIAFNGSPLQVK